MKQNQTAFLKLCLADALIKLMQTQAFDAISVQAICKQADVGRTTFYRHFASKDSKEELLIFKIHYEWQSYAARHEAAVEQDRGAALTGFIYENKTLFSLLHQNGLITALMRVFEELLSAGAAYDKPSSYLASFFIYGYFGLIYQWIKYNFDETPEQIQTHISAAFSAHTPQNG